MAIVPAIFTHKVACRVDSLSEVSVIACESDPWFLSEATPLITDIAKIEAYINSAGTPRFATNRIIQLGATRKASISQTVIDNAVAKGWTVTW